MTRMSKRFKQHLGITIALTVAIAFGVLSNFFYGEWLLSPGEMTPGHENLSCKMCHQNAPGSIRQQLQAKTQFWLGNREKDAELGFAQVGNSRCQSCHQRPKDRHPVYRFLEPRFKKVRQELAPQYCASCHREHRAQRVSMSPSACKACHAKLSLKRDPLTITHKSLVEKKQWNTCLGCHDYHGNHALKSPSLILGRIKEQEILEYFGAGDTPYPLPKKYKAKEKLDNES
ncbi:MAG: cytochrome c3 family protein [Gammaproteobacteria bacterium]|nr:cytochrome c3 family protein [Gammaproteobacteria bacterium]